MSLTSAMLVGFTGIQSNQTSVTAVGDDIANLNTTAFKQQRTLFETLIYDTISPGTAPSEGSGGTLPRQVGRGSAVSVVQRDFRQGAIEATGVESDLALDGQGYLVLEDTDSTLRYTRDGSFTLNSENTLISRTGLKVRGYAADESGAIVRDALSDIVIPLGQVGEPKATGEVVLGGTLNAADAVAATGQVSASQPLRTASGSAASATTALTDLVDENGGALFAAGDEVELSINKGGGTLPSSTFVVGTTGSTLGDFASYLETVAGIYVDPTLAPGAGVAVSAGPEPEAGTLVISSNVGAPNAVKVHRDGDEIEYGEIRNLRTGATPFEFTSTTLPVGEGVSTNFEVYDSLGNRVEARLRLVLESKTTDGTQWRYFAESLDDSDLSPILGTGTMLFDASGRFVSAAADPLAIDRAGTGAATPMSVTLDFSNMTAPATATSESQMYMASQDGTPAGELVGYEIDSDGIVRGNYSNQQKIVLGQLAVATFLSDEGLLAQSQNTFLPGPNSGDAIIGVANEGAAGAIVPGALEQSNVELVREFVDLIAASTGISAASRIVRTSDDMLQELMLLAR